MLEGREGCTGLSPARFLLLWVSRDQDDDDDEGGGGNGGDIYVCFNLLEMVTHGFWDGGMHTPVVSQHSSLACAEYRSVFV